MTPSPAILGFLRRWELLRTKAYLDRPGGVWTIGYGHTLRVCQGDVCTASQAETWLAADAQSCADSIDRAIDWPISQQQLDALVSFTFNVGTRSLYAQDFSRGLRSADDEMIAAQMLRWTHDDGVEVPNLVKRRAAEVAILLHGDYTGSP